REERFVDGGPLVVADTEAPELIEPGERALDNPPPASQPAAMPGPPHCDQRQNATRSQAASDDRRIVAAVPDHTIWPSPRPSTFALKWRNRINQRQFFLRIISVGPGQPHGKRHASRVADEMTLASSLGAISGIWTGLSATMHSAD